MIRKNRFPFYHQVDSKDCGPTCIKIIAKSYGKLLDSHRIRELAETLKQGSSFLGLINALEELGFKSMALKIDVDKLSLAPLPCILHWNGDHYVVLYKIKKGNKFFISDPAHGLLEYNFNEFIEGFCFTGSNNAPNEGYCIIVEPTAKFYTNEVKKQSSLSLSFLLKYLVKYRKYIFQLQNPEYML